jgi:TolB protein
MAVIRFTTLISTIAILTLVAMFTILRQEPSTASWIAFTTKKGASTFDIYRIRPDGSGLTQITFEPGPKYLLGWSPDSRSIAYLVSEQGANNIYLRYLNTPYLHQLTFLPDNLVSLNWSPDGRSINFITDDDGTSSLYNVKLDGTNLRILAVLPIKISTPTWTSDREWIAFASEGDIIKMRHDGTQIDNVTTSESFDYKPTWSPDGRWIAFEVSYGTTINLIRADGSQNQPIPNLPTVSQIFSPHWSPDGDWIVFSAGNPLERSNLYRIHPDGTELQQLTHAFTVDYAPQWSPPIDHPYSPATLILTALGLLTFAAISINRTTQSPNPRPKSPLTDYRRRQVPSPFVYGEGI